MKMNENILKSVWNCAKRDFDTFFMLDDIIYNLCNISESDIKYAFYKLVGESKFVEIKGVPNLYRISQ